MVRRPAASAAGREVPAEGLVAVLSTTAAYISIASNINRQQAATAADPSVKTATAYYIANISNVSTVSQFVNNYQLFSYAMKAYGLGDMVYAKGMMTKLLTEGVSSSSALANTLSDPRYKAFANAFNFAALGASATSQASATSTTVSNYIEQSLEDNQAKTDQGVANALYFKRNASSITSVYGLLGNATMLSVVETAFGISSSLSASDIDTQAAVLGSALNISDLQDPTKVEKLVERYTAQYDVSTSPSASNVLLLDTSNTNAANGLLDTANGNSTPAADSVLNLFTSSSSTANGVSSSLLLSLAKLQHGGS